MSVEGYVISALVQEGSPKRAFQAGISLEDFELYDQEFGWLIDRAERRRPISVRQFKRKFPEFDLIRPDENIGSLLEELKQERAFVAVQGAIDEIYSGDEPLDQDNALDKAVQLREVLGDVVKLHAPHSDVAIKSGWQRAYERVKNLSILRANGQSPGIPTGIDHFDHHFGGLQAETTYLFLGRPGDAKSFTLAKLVIEAAYAGFRVGMFSPEMTEHQHNCRFHTLLSAKDEIQKDAGLKSAFRNRALKDGLLTKGQMFAYRNFLKWLEENLEGEIHLFTQKYRREKMSTSYIESRIEDLGLDLVIIDPIYKLRSPRKRGTRWEELLEITDSLINLSHTFNIPVVMSNQASRALVGRKGEPPDKDSSFGADAPVQEANCVIGVKHYSEERTMKFNCSKNRDGEPFKFTAKFVPNLGILKDVTPISGSYTNGYDPEKREELQEAMKEAGI